MTVLRRLKHKVYEAAKNVPNPANASETLYDTWKRWANIGSNVQVEPSVTLPGAGSDYTAFVYNTGIPVIDLTFRHDTKTGDYKDINYIYPAYHTGFDTFTLINDVLDKDPFYGIHSTCSKIVLYMGRDFADSILLDYNINEYAVLMKQAVQDFRANGAFDVMDDNGVNYVPWTNMITTFERAAGNFTVNLDATRAQSEPLLARMINDQMMELERFFIIPRGVTKFTDDFNHAIVSPGYNELSVGVFPGVSGLCAMIKGETDSGVRTELVKELKLHLTELMVALKGASDFLNELHLIV